MTATTATVDDIAATDYPSPGMVHVWVEKTAEVDRELDSAIAAVKEAAFRHRTGIVITRTEPGHYIVRAHPEVPFGLIRQRYS